MRGSGVRRLVTAALIGIAAAAGAQPASLQPNPAFQGLAAEVQAACPASYPPPWDTPQLLHHARRISGLVPVPADGCAPQPALALRIASTVANVPAHISGFALSLLAELHERGIGTRPDPARALTYRRRSWLIIQQRQTAPPFADEAELDAYVARPETIAFLSRYAEAPDLPRARMRLARALFLRGRPEDRARAARLLNDAGLAGDLFEADFIRERDVLASGIEGEDRRRALAGLRRLVRGYYPQAQALLADLARRQLAEARRPEQRWDAIEWFGDLAFQGDAGHRATLLRHATAANGGRPPPRLAGPPVERFAPLLAFSITDEDYPAAALRTGEGGVVRLLGLVDPRGRTIYTEPAGPEQNPRLLAAARRLHASRRRPAADLGEARLAPYMWIELAPMTFIILDGRRGSVRLSFSPPER